MSDSGNDNPDTQKLHDRISKLEKNLEEIKNVNTDINKNFDLWIVKMNELYDIINKRKCLEKYPSDSDSEENKVVPLDQKQQPIEDPVEDPVINPVEDSVVNPVINPVINPVVNPVTNPVEDPIEEEKKSHEQLQSLSDGNQIGGKKKRLKHQKTKKTNKINKRQKLIKNRKNRKRV